MVESHRKKKNWKKRKKLLEEGKKEELIKWLMKIKTNVKWIFIASNT